MDYQDALKKAQQSRKKAEQKAAQDFANGGYKVYQDTLKSQNKRLSDTMQSGKTVNDYDLNEFQNTINHFKKMTSLSGFDDFSQSQLDNIAQQYQNNHSVLKELNDLISQRNTSRRELEKAKSEKRGSWLTDLTKGMRFAGGTSDIQSSIANENQYNSEYYDKKIYDAQQRLNSLNSGIAPYLDLELTRERKDGEKAFSEEKKNAVEDYQLAYKAHHQQLAENYMKDNLVKEIAKKAAFASADKDEGVVPAAMEGFANGVFGSNNTVASNKAMKNAFAEQEYKAQLIGRLKELGYKGTDEELQDTANAIFEKEKRGETKKRQETINKDIAEIANDHPVIASAASTVAGGVSKIPGAIYSTAKTIEGWTTDKPVYMDENSAFFKGSNITGTITNTVASNIKSDTWREVYTGAMSFADNLSRAAVSFALGPAGETASLAVMAASVMSDTALEMTKLGYDAKTAGTLAAVAATAEIITEKISLDSLIEKVPNGTGARGYFFKMAKQIFAEASEEGASDVINNVADLMLEMWTDQDSQKTKQIESYLQSGMSFDSAYKKWQKEHITEYVKDMAMGGLSGGLMGGGVTAVNIGFRTVGQTAPYVAESRNEIEQIKEEYKRQGKNITSSYAKTVANLRGSHSLSNNTNYAGYKSLINNGLNHSNEKVQEQARTLKKDFIKTGKVSPLKAGRLMNYINAANTNITKGIVEQMLTGTEESQQVIESVVKAVAGDELSKKDIRNIRHSANALELINLLYTEATKSVYHPDGEKLHLTADSNDEIIKSAVKKLYGATFDIDMETEPGKLYATAADLRANGDIGFNGMKGFLVGYNLNLNLSLEQYSNLFKFAYNEAKTGKSVDEIMKKANALVQGKNNEATVLRAFYTAQNDVKYEREQEKIQKKEEQAQSDLEESETDELTKETVESVNKLRRLSESEKAEKFKNGGAIVESKQKLTTQQSAIISFYDYRGKKHGITYRFVDSIESNEDARGEYNHQTEIIQIRIGAVADMTATAGHELGHWLKAHYPEEYERMQQYLKDTVFKTNYESKVAAKIAAYKKAGISIDEEAAFEELTNDCLFGVDMASSEYEEFVRANETLMQKTFRVIRELLQDLQHFLEDWRKQLPEMYKQVTEIKMVQELYDDVEFMEYTADWVDRILNQNAASEQSAASEQTTAAGEQKNSTTAESGVRYSVPDNDVVDLTYSGLAEELEGVYGKERREAIASYILSKLNNKIHFIDGLEAIVDNKDAIHLGHMVPKKEAAAIDKIEELISKSFPYAEENNPIHDGKPHKKFTYFRYYKVDVRLKTENYSLYLNVGKARVDKQYHLYDITTKLRNTANRINGLERLSEYLSANGISNSSIRDNSEKSNSSFQVSDTDYLEAARNGDEEKAAEYVEQAAKEWGAFSDGKPAPINLYHGTKSFGFTEFDLQKMDDKRSIFLTSDEVTAQSYSSVMGKRKISDSPKPIDYRNMSKKELVNALNKYSVFNDAYDVDYTYLSKEQIDSLIASKTEEIEELRDMLTEELRNFSMPQQKSDSIHRLLEIVHEGITGQIASNLYMATQSKGNAYLDVAKYESIHDRIYRISVFEDTDKDINDGAIMETMGTGYYEIIPEKEAKGILKNWSSNTAGNYSLYAKFNRPLIIDCKGANWNQIPGKGFEFISESGKPYRAEFVTTREFAKIAQIDGYDGVIFKNIRDNGGRGMKDPGITDYIAVAFDSSQVKSADPITYDDNGEIIPLSERFSESKDIRYSIADTTDGEKFVKIDENEIDLKNGESIAKNIATILNNKFNNLIVVNKQFIRVNQKTNKEFRNSSWATRLFGDHPDWYEDKIKALANADEILKAAQNWVNEELKHSRKDNIVSFGRAHVLYMVGASGYEADVLVGVRADGSALLYDIIDIKDKKITEAPAKVGKTNSRPVQNASASSIVPQSNDDVNHQISDTNLTPEQRAAIERKAERREMARFQRENEELKEALAAARQQRFLSKDYRHNKSQTPKIAKRLLKQMSVVDLSDEEQERFIAALDYLYDTIDDNKLENSGGSDVTLMAAMEAVELVRDNIRYTEKYEELADRAQEFADYFKGRTYISEAQAKELRYHFGGVDKANQLVHGVNFAIAKGGETTLDMQWREIMDTFPDFISEELTDTDEPLAIIKAMQDAREMIDGTLYSPFEAEKLAERAEGEDVESIDFAEAELMNDLAMKLIDSYSDAEWKATFADRKQVQKTVALIQQKQKYRESMRKWRIKTRESEKNKAEKGLKAYKKHIKESRKKAYEKKRKTEYKNKIKKIAFELGSMAANPNKKKHIPSGILKTTHEFLSMIETGDMTQERLNHYIGAITQEFDSLENGVIYEALKSDYNAKIHDMLKEVVNRDENIRLKELSSEELEKVYKIARVIKRAVSEMNLFHYVDKNRTVVEYQNALIEERKGKIKLQESTLQGAYRKFRDNELKPVYFFESLNSPTMSKLYQAIRAGQAVVAQDTKEAEDVMLRLRKKHGYSKWDLQKTYKFKLEHCNEAKEVELTLPQIMSLKALSEREAGLSHLLDGGFQIRYGTDARRTIKGKLKSRIDKTEYRITADELQTIIDTLTPEQVAFVHEMRDYLAHELSKKGNEVSRKMWDIEIFGEDKYFPIHTSDDFNAKGDQKVIEGKMLKNWGSSKQLVPHAHNPLVLEEFGDAWAGHVEEMANYHAFTLPLEDFQKVYGYSNVLTADEEHQLQETNPDDNILQTVSIQNLFTNSQQAYIEKFIGDVNGSIIKSDETLSTRGISKYKKISTALNLRVTVQQPGAIARAFLYISPKYFVQTTGTGLKGIKSDSAAVQEMEKYSDAAFFKSLGFFDVGEGRSIKEYLNPESYEGKQKFTALAYDGDYRDSKMLAMPEMMDRITWVHIWEATKAKVAAEEHLEGEALLKRAGKMFNDVVDKTQVYDSIFTRSGHMRSNNPLAKMATAFLAEPTTTINMYYNALTQWKMGNVNKSFVAKAFASCFTATFLTNLLASVVSAMRHGKDDDNWWELWVGEFTSDFLTDIVLVNSIPLVRDIFSIAKGWDVERADMTLASSFIDSVKKLTKAQQEGRATGKEWYDFIAASAAMIGVPVLSLKKDIFGVFQAVRILSNKTKPTKEGTGKAIVSGLLDAAAVDDLLSIKGPSTNKYDTIYQLYATGNTKEAERRKEILFKYDEKANQEGLDGYIAGQLLFNKDVISAASSLMKGDMKTTKSEMAKVKNFDEALVLKAMVKMLNEQVDEDAEVTEKSLIKGSAKKTIEQNLLLNNQTVRKAAIALNNNDDETRYNLQSKLVNEGYSLNDVINITKTVKSKMFPEEKKDSSSDKTAKYFQYTDVADALAAGNTQFATEVMNHLIEDYAKEGKSEEDVKKQVRSKITSTFKEEYYMASESRRAEIRIAMWKSGAYDSGDDVLKICNGWVKDIAKKKFGN